MQYFRIKQAKKFPPQHTNICKIIRLCGSKFSLVFNKSLLNLATGLFYGVLSKSIEGFSVTCPSQKPEENVQGYINIPYTTKIHVLAINPTTTILAKAFLKSSHLVFPEKIKRDRGSVPIISLIPWQLPYNLICNFHSKTIDRLPIHVIVKHHTCSTSVAFYPWWIESGNLERISWSFYIEIVTWNKKVLATENLISASPSSVDWRPCIPIQKGDAILSCS